MKLSIAFLALALLGPLNAAPEKVLVITDGDISVVTEHLEDGWTVKHQGVSSSGAGVGINKEFRSIVVFTLSPPSEEILAAAKEKREKEWAQKRIDYLNKRLETK
jgi:hypothetical protein